MKMALSGATRFLDGKCGGVVSIIINNHNYQEYLASAITSALAQTYHSVEIVVVDDGSTDSSVEIARAFSDRVKVIVQNNSGQGAAYNTGFSNCSGDFICFLDADDRLMPSTCELVAKMDWSAVSKVQGRLAIIDAEGHANGRIIPFNRMSETEVAESATRFYFYNSPPGSGNFYSRTFLQKVLPLPEQNWRISADAYLICRAPFHGAVRSVTEVLGQYRIHGKNATAEGLDNTEAAKAVFKYANREYLKEQKRRSSAIVYYRNWYSEKRRLHDTPSMIKFRLALYKSRGRLFRCRIFYFGIVTRTVYCALYWKPYSVSKRILFILWVVSMLILPKSIFVRVAPRSLFAYERGF
jgi:glycosyltransferase involved in cell wall biosynthesis